MPKCACSQSVEKAKLKWSRSVLILFFFCLECIHHYSIDLQRILKDEEALPARLVKPTTGNLIWLLDHDAASLSN